MGGVCIFKDSCQRQERVLAAGGAPSVLNGGGRGVKGNPCGAGDLGRGVGFSRDFRAPGGVAWCLGAPRKENTLWGDQEDVGILRSEKRDLGDPGESVSRDEIPKVRNGVRPRQGLPRDLGVLRVGCQLPQAADGLSFHLVLAKAGPGRGWLWKVEGIGQRLGFAREKQGGGEGRRGRETQCYPRPGPSPAPLVLGLCLMGRDPDRFSGVGSPRPGWEDPR
ncbi:hypothetical protein Cadr_000003406 [Camelus dromedarius]|uniref:Uncharacterized protein n=1 Tax=Camelus dromedarius TaxID=9838 RepID=A0A5N4C0V1_CAMDR|nr:hypothetical protein Cadr_000003406 [Camelus dromedarius]